MASASAMAYQGVGPDNDCRAHSFAVNTRTSDGARRVNPKLFLKQLYARYDNDGVADSAASLAYYLVFALFPFLFLLTALGAYLPYVRASADTVLERARAILPPAAMGLIDTHVRDLIDKPRPRLLTAGILLTIYSASRGVDSVRKALNRASGVQESRPLWKTEALAFGLTTSGAILVLTGIAALVAGGDAGFWLARQAGIGEAYVLVWRWLRWPVTAGAIMLCAALGYHLLPAVEQRFKFFTVGSVIGTLAWFLSTWVFSVYATHFGNYNVAYGALGGVIVLMTWFYLTGFIFILGGEINALVSGRDLPTAVARRPYARLRA